MFQDARERALMCRLIPPLARDKDGSTAHLTVMSDELRSMFYICSFVNISSKLASAVRDRRTDIQRCV